MESGEATVSCRQWNEYSRPGVASNLPILPLRSDFGEEVDRGYHASLHLDAWPEGAGAYVWRSWHLDPGHTFHQLFYFVVLSFDEWRDCQHTKEKAETVDDFDNPPFPTLPLRQSLSPTTSVLYYYYS